VASAGRDRTRYGTTRLRRNTALYADARIDLLPKKMTRDEKRQLASAYFATNADWLKTPLKS
jgi:beta-glucosidase